MTVRAGGFQGKAQKEVDALPLIKYRDRMARILSLGFFGKAYLLIVTPSAALSASANSASRSPNTVSSLAVFIA